MAASGYTPIILLNSTTTGNTPTTSNLAVGELAINVTDGKLFFNQSGTIKVLANATYATSVSTISFGTTGLTPSTATNGVVTVAGTLATTNGGTGLTSFTANGVVYASSTSALATGSALVFDGTNLGIGTSSPAYKLDVLQTQNGLSLVNLTNASTGTSARSGFSANSDTVSANFLATGSGYTGVASWQGAGVISVGSGSTNGLILNVQGQPIKFQISTTEQMRLDSSGNLGVGTTSPVGRLSVIGSDNTTQAVFSGSIGTTGRGLRIATSLIASNNEGAILDAQATTGSATLIFQTASTERARIDSSGNLGLGVTPSAWTSVFKALQVGAKGSLAYYNGTTYLSENFYNDGTSAKYLTTDYASQYNQTGGQHQWFTAPSGTAGTAISFTQAMTLDSNGDLGIGTTSPSSYGKLAVVGNGAVSNLISTSATGSVWQQFYNNSGSTTLGYVGYLSGSSNQMYLSQSQNAALVFATNATEAARIDSSGNLLVGTTTSTSKLVVATKAAGTNTITLVGGLQSNFTGDSAINFQAYNSGGGFGASGTILVTQDASGNTSAGRMTFSTSGAGGGGEVERMRLDSSGNLLVGTTSALGGGGKFSILWNGTSYNAIELQESSSTSGAGFLSFRRADGTQIGSVVRVGTTAAVMYNTTSDYRLKTVVGAVTGQGARIDALKPIDYTWKEGGQQARGFLAHEFQTVYANSVTGTKDAVDADGKPVYQSMQAGTAEVIADLVAEMQSLRKRLAAAGI